MLSRTLVCYLISRFTTVMIYQMQSLAIGWQVYSLHKNPMDLGWVGLAQFLPMFGFALWGGQVADRYDRRKIMMSLYLLWSVTSITLYYTTITEVISMPIVLSLLVLQGSLRAFTNPASQAFITQLVPPEKLNRAIAINANVFQSSLILGPVLGGILLGWFGHPHGVYAVSFFGMLIGTSLLLFVKAQPQERSVEPISFQNLFAGVKYVWQKKEILGATSLDLFAVLFGGVVALLPVFAADVLHVGAEGLGWLRAAPGLGAIAAGSFLAVSPIRHKVGRALFLSVAIFGLATIGFGLSKNFVLSCALLFVAGCADVVSVVVRMTLVQLKTPPAMRGRVSAVNTIFISASNELGEFESGLAASLFGLVPAVIIGGLAAIGVCAFWSKLFPELYHLDEI